MSTSPKTTTRTRATTYTVVIPLLKTLYEELKDLAKKKPDASLSKTKIKIVNRLLERCRLVLEAEPELEFLDLLDSEGAVPLPQASDAVLMIGQYVAAMKSFKDRYCYFASEYDSSYTRYWHVEDGHLLAEDGDAETGDDGEDDDDDEDGD